MEIQCPSCDQRLEVPEELFGQTIECPACDASLAAPSDDPNVPDVRKPWCRSCKGHHGTKSSGHGYYYRHSGGDNSYPGFVAITPMEALVSWYSSHEGTASIYMANLKIKSE